jgi:catechol 2,3-dioxygenase-like lactoylglutathione lyase family enzyme
MIHGVHHVAIATGDIDGLMDWYQRAFGFELISKGEWKPGNAVNDSIVGLRDSGAKTGFLQGGNLLLEFFQYTNPVGRPGDPNRPVCDHGYTHFGVTVDNIDAEHDRLVALGMRFHAPPTPKDQMGGRLRACYGRDPEGNVIELLEFFDARFPQPVRR